MSREYADGYLKGYEDGLREALEELIGNTCRKNFNSTEIQLLAKNQRSAVPKKLALRRRQMEREMGLDLDREEASPTRQEAGPGKTVLLKGEGNQEAMEAFRDLVQAGWDGLCISRMCPRDVRHFVGRDCTVLWLTKADPMAGDQDREEYLLPTETAKMQTSIRNFLTRNKGKPSVILLDGMTFIITNTDFRSFLKIAQKLKDDVYQAQSLLLLPYEPKNLAENEVHLLINEMS
ncbi:MAG: hypothetical protein A4E29_01091 [Methanomassiliicoccales archaeon PtaB.Bin134]|nr:MAG: hypothetical protein A4E29_01091 [Methanomassiliicoccales archaeon PtaB.Bin134]